MTAFILFSCSVDGQGSESVFLTASSIEESSSSLASEESSSSVSRSSSSSSRSKSSSSSAKSSSDSKTYYTVSVYQSYWISDKQTYGNPRFDFNTKVESGKPLYANVEEKNALEDRCNEVYYPNGEAYVLIGFYVDESCKKFVGTKLLIESDMNVYYHCEG